MNFVAAISIPENLLRILEGIPAWVWMLFAGLLILKFFYKLWLPSFKGWVGEAAVRRVLQRLDAARYASFHDLYLPRPDGKGTTQLDHVVVSAAGIFVIETKNFKGWIFGTEKQKQWTQKIYKYNQRFQNPLHQNNLHIEALSEFLPLERGKCHSVVVFTGDSTFKTEMPPNVLNRGFVKYIEGFTEAILEKAEVDRIAEILRKLDAAHDRKILAREHVKAIRERRQ